MKAVLNALRETPDMRAIDLQLAQFAVAMDGEGAAAEVMVVTALASMAVAVGDVYVELQDCLNWAERHSELVCANSLPRWREVLQDSAAFNALGETEAALLILDRSDRVYLSRYYRQEQNVAQRLHGVAGEEPADTDLREVLDLLFAPDNEQPDWQRVAAAIALRQRFVVISGGPGTGKTRTVARLLCLLQHLSSEPLNMKLAAPTGKAAARLSQSIQREIPALQKLLPEAAEHVPVEASTLHRLLGYRADGHYRHGADNPLALDLLLVDEASMLDLGMMWRLLASMPPRARLILLGDRDQLASVDAGNVLADIAADLFDGCSESMLDYLKPLCPSVEQSLQPSLHPLADSVTLLRRSYRFDADSVVGNLSRAINTGDWPALEALLDAGSQDLQLLTADANGWQQATDRFVAHYRQLMRSESAAIAHAALSRFQLLCALRRGTAGVEDVNAMMARALSRAGLVAVGEHQPGRAIMVQQNDYGQRLYNGDVGLFWPDEQGQLQVWFDDGMGGLRSVLPTRLPSHESCYAMTIHKTQGSEFQEVCILLPSEPAAILNRQLLYTGVTRARERVSICARKAVIQGMLQNQQQRRSGLRDALRQFSQDNPA
ncbi:MAG: exodeoxyribonuclease V subunit alpha [Granulosicoccaceae bacterium]